MEAGNTGGGYGLLDWLAGGSWAEQQAVAATAGEAPVSVPGLPAGDSASEVKDSDGDLVLDLVLGGNWIELQMLSTDPTLPKATVPQGTAILNLANAVETTVRG